MRVRGKYLWLKWDLSLWPLYQACVIYKTISMKTLVNEKTKPQKPKLVPKNQFEDIVVFFVACLLYQGTFLFVPILKIKLKDMTWKSIDKKSKYITWVWSRCKCALPQHSPFDALSMSTALTTEELSSWPTNTINNFTSNQF